MPGPEGTIIFERSLHVYDGPMPMFTGKERDSETGLDFFGARYFSAAQGRSTTPDWSMTPQPVPYADLSDPQTLNLYGYVRNNPLSRTDPDGHCCWDYIVGFAKGTANQLLDTVAYNAKNGDPGQKQLAQAMQTNFRFASSGADQQSGMQAGSKYGPDAVGAAVAIVGARGGKGEALPNEALVVRGGVKVSENAVGTHESGVTGVSVESAPGKSVQQLATESPIVSGYGQVRCCTVGDVRSAGGDVIPTQGLSPNHATLTGLPPVKINEVLKPPIPNPAKQQ